MPTCCVPSHFQFINALSTTIAYTPAMVDKYGTTPRVFVYYRDPADGTFLLSPFFTLAKFFGGNIVVDHGGEQSGFVVVT